MPKGRFQFYFFLNFFLPLQKNSPYQNWLVEIVKHPHIRFRDVRKNKCLKTVSSRQWNEAREGKLHLQILIGSSITSDTHAHTHAHTHQNDSVVLSPWQLLPVILCCSHFAPCALHRNLHDQRIWTNKTPEQYSEGGRLMVFIVFYPCFHFVCVCARARARMSICVWVCWYLCVFACLWTYEGAYTRVCDVHTSHLALWLSSLLLLWPQTPVLSYPSHSRERPRHTHVVILKTALTFSAWGISVSGWWL